MNKVLFACFCVIFSLVVGARGEGDAPPPKPEAPKSEAQSQLEKLVKEINGKLSEGKHTEEDLADQIKQFDVLLAQHKGEKTDDVADILVMKTALYLDVFRQLEKGLPLLKQIKADFPGCPQVKQAEALIPRVERAIESEKVQRQMAVGAVFPDFKEQDLDGKPLSADRFKGKVVLVDFWATWCGPCVEEMPNIIEAYQKYHSKGFEIIGINLDQDRDEVTRFTKQHKMTWPQYFDGLGWDNKLVVRYGVRSIPTMFLLDRKGKIVGKNLFGDALEEQLAKLLAK